MDTKVKYIQLIKEVLEIWTNSSFLEGQDLQTESVYDEEKSRYMLITHGYDNGETVFDTIASVKVSDQDQIVIEHNITDTDFKQMLVNKGVPLSDIL